LIFTAKKTIAIVVAFKNSCIFATAIEILQLFWILKQVEKQMI